MALTGGLACLGATTAILLAAPQSAVLGSVILVLALLLLLPLLLDVVVVVFDRLQVSFGYGLDPDCRRSNCARRETRTRSLAIAATGAIAVFGSVTIQGAHANLQHGLDRLVHRRYRRLPTCGCVPPGTQNLLATTPFPTPSASKLGAAPR